MGKSTRKRKAGYALAIVFLTLLFLIAALPLWFPWLLRPLLEKQGIRYSRYERDGYGQFILNEVNVSQPKMKFKARRVEVLLPAKFLWRLFKEDPHENYLQVSDWTLQLLETGKGKKTDGSVYHSAEKLEPMVTQLNRWLPTASFTNGVIYFHDKKVLIPAAAWRNGTLAAQIGVEKFLPETTFSVQLSKASGQIASKTGTWNLETKLNARREQQFLKIEGVVTWQSNLVEVAAQFGHDDLFPQSASLRSKSFRVPAPLLALEGYRELTGSLDARWETNRFALQLTASAEPNENGQTFLSPVEAEIRASGDTNSIRIESANISSPWLQGELSQNVEFNFRGEMLSPVARLRIAGDLSRQKWIAAQGRLTGEAVLQRGQNPYPDTTFVLSGAGIEMGKIKTERLDLHGKFEWPWLGIQSATVQFKEGGTAQGSLLFNAVSRRVSDGVVKVNGQIGQSFLPPEIFYKNISLVSQVSGPLTNLSHSGHVELQGMKLPNFTPLGVIADWDGTKFDLQNFQAKVAAGNSSLTMSGSSESQANRLSAHIQSLVLASNAQPLFHLTNAFEVSVMGTVSNRAIRVEPFLWRGEKSEISFSGGVQWPNRGAILGTVKEFNFGVFQDFSEGLLPEATIERLNLAAHWTNGPLNFVIEGLAGFASPDGTHFSADVRASGDVNGVSIERATVRNGIEAVVSGKGFLPVRFNPAIRSNLVETLPKQRIDFEAATMPSPQFWERVSKWTHTTFEEPSGSIAVTGTLDSPSGKILLNAKEIVFKPPRNGQAIPRLQNVVVDFDLVRDRIALRRFEILVEGQPVTAVGELPLPDNLEANWKTIFDWRKASGNLKMVDAQIAPFVRLFPKFLSPLGTVNLDLRAAAGKLEGELRVVGAALRPVPSLGPVHDIEARVKLLGDAIKLETFKGSIGGQPIELAGEMELAKEKGAALPLFDFKLRGTNVPLTRQPELILRSDIDLNFSNKKGSGALVSGTLNLRDSFYLDDVKRLIPGKVAKAKQRPPYFSVETEPFAGWRLDVAVRGNNFFKVRSPIFRGELSADLKIQGTLKEPVALGDATINSGVVQFPFANLRVGQGFISLTSENPYRPQLSVNASARTFGYDVKMTLSGPADKPMVEFSSNPGLTSEQILLMITAGELPHDEITFSTQQKAGRLAFFLGKGLYSKFGGTGESKLEIRSGDDISEQGRQTYFLEYKLTKDWSIVGEYDRFGGVNAGVKWIFFSK